jgi:hypothetical protein
MPSFRSAGPAAEPRLVATFCYDLDGDVWSWAPVAGADADDLRASAAVFGEDGDGEAREHLEGIVAAALGWGPVVYRGVVDDPDGIEHEVLALAETVKAGPGPLLGLRGFIFDLVAPRACGIEDEVIELRVEVDMLWQALRDSDLAGQAKGVIMASCGCSAHVASEVIDELVLRSGLSSREVAEWLIRSSCSGQGSLAEALASLGLRGER